MDSAETKQRKESHPDEKRTGRRPGEVGGHTLRPSEQKEPARLGELQQPGSMDVPVAEDGAEEATRGAGMESVRKGTSTEGGSGKDRNPGSKSMKPSGTGDQPQSRTQTTQAEASSAEAAETVEEREGVAASRPPKDGHRVDRKD